MKKKLIMPALALYLILMTACGESNTVSDHPNNGLTPSPIEETLKNTDTEKNTDTTKNTDTEKSNTSNDDVRKQSGLEEPQSIQVVETDLKPSKGLKFESNGDDTCTITGIGTCTDKNIVIPIESPDGDTVTLIENMPCILSKMLTALHY